jgi:hypothetical protein
MPNFIFIQQISVQTPIFTWHSLFFSSLPIYALYNMSLFSTLPCTTLHFTLLYFTSLLWLHYTSLYFTLLHFTYFIYRTSEITFLKLYLKEVELHGRCFSTTAGKRFQSSMVLFTKEYFPMSFHARSPQYALYRALYCVLCCAVLCCVNLNWVWGTYCLRVRRLLAHSVYLQWTIVNAVMNFRVP